MRSGKYTLGEVDYNFNNCPPLRKSEIEYYAMLAKVGCTTTTEMLPVCARLYPIFFSAFY
ncbi:Ribosomal protein L30e [Prunus yedoensis var. nudiflora]|uniref:Ribosomal protein L30e n=1 Tax=Prunus yedoensis var. nudiflora TaxID=2094558 RepID=A0A314YVH6_PRUYE|nr:Ribosomal protein L30e [Prunus yedoensis var. nudiflora]PQP93485.1 Ribosomal protein L30e [Prunus yedoensis var. nudiflora]